jgi:thioredoxin-like negative regulator of GroEL
MELTVDQALQQGIAAHKEGKLQDAERLYRAILQAQPKHPDANHNLGVLAVAVGNLLTLFHCSNWRWMPIPR